MPEKNNLDEVFRLKCFTNIIYLIIKLILISLIYLMLIKQVKNRNLIKAKLSSFCNENYFIRERLNPKEIEDPLKNKISSELMKEILNNKYSFSHNWITYPLSINPKNKSVNSIYPIVVNDIVASGVPSKRLPSLQLERTRK